MNDNDAEYMRELKKNERGWGCRSGRLESVTNNEWYLDRS